MTREFVETIIFSKRWDEMNLSNDNMIELQNTILNNPEIGNIIEGTGGAAKLRFALPNTGKSGGIRVIYVNITHKEKIYLILCYPKSKQDNLTSGQKRIVKNLVKELKGED